MSHPFPAMNPYLENPALWQKIHKRLIVAIADALSPEVRPVFIVVIKERVYKYTNYDEDLIDASDVAAKASQTAKESEIVNFAVGSQVQPVTVKLPIPETVRESYLEITDVNTKEVITVIEVISPKNKSSGEENKVWVDEVLKEKGIR